MTGLLPERLVRTLVLLVATIGAFAPLALRAASGPDAARGLRDASVALALLLLAAFQSLRAEATPEDLDSPSARRAKRFAPLAVGLLLVGLFVFPRFDPDGGVLTLLFFANLPLVAYWHVPSVRAVSLVVASVAALGGTVFVRDDVAAPALLPIGAAWTLVPALDRLAAVRARLEPRPPAVLGPTLRTAGLVLAAGLALFVAARLALPPSTRSWVASSFLASTSPRGEPPPTPDLPIGRLLALLGAAALTLLMWNAYASRLGTRRRTVEQLLPMATAAPRRLDPEAVARAVGEWPLGPRRAVVEAYLGHVLAIEAKGEPRGPAMTPRGLARLLAAALSPLAGDAATRLADRFGRARWDPAPIGADEPATARAEVAHVERELG